MKSKKFKIWKEAYRIYYPVEYATLSDKDLYEIFLLGEK